LKEDRATIWTNIVTELEAAVQLIPVTSGSKYSVTKGMAFTLLAKLYLNAKVYKDLADFDNADLVKANAYCDSVIALGQYSLESDPLAPFVTENELSPENIFTIGYDEDTYKGFNLHMRTLHYESKLTYDMTVQPWNGFAAMEDFYNSFEPNDKRKAMFLADTQYSASGELLRDPGANNDVLVFTPNIPALKMDATYTLDQIRMSGVRVVKFEVKQGASDNLSNDFPIFRYADVLLMKAETQIRLNGEGAGDYWINMIRSRAGLDDISNATLDDLLLERGHEFIWEAQRRMDLIRFGKFQDSYRDTHPGISPCFSVESVQVVHRVENPEIVLEKASSFQ